MKINTIFNNLFEIEENELNLDSFMENVDRILIPYTDKFEIPLTKNTKPGNTGKVGFFIESLFGILPNNSRNPDFGNFIGELKTVKLSRNSFTSVSIATISRSSYNRINLYPTKGFFNDSAPYLKMRNTLYVFYRKVKSYPDEYVVDSWKMINLDNLSKSVKDILKNDYSICSKALCRHSYEKLSGPGNHFPNTQYLQLTYKGSRGYNYPSWKFSKEFMKIIQYS
jgi:hypothetical protein